MGLWRQEQVKLTKPGCKPSGVKLWCHDRGAFVIVPVVAVEDTPSGMGTSDVKPATESVVLPHNAEMRKDIPVATGFVDYFPDAMAAVAECSAVATAQHHHGEPLHWDRAKSSGEADALMRHFLERGTLDTDGVRHSTKVAWRAMALLQKELEDARTN